MQLSMLWENTEGWFQISVFKKKSAYFRNALQNTVLNIVFLQVHWNKPTGIVFVQLVERFGFQLGFHQVNRWKIRQTKHLT